MKKSLKHLILAIIIGGVVTFVGCTKEKNHEKIGNYEENIPSNPNNVLFDSTIYSVYIDYYNHFLSDSLGELNSNPSESNIVIVDDTLNFLIINSQSILPNSNNVPTSRLISFMKNNGEVDAHVIDYSKLTFNNGVLSGGSISFRLINGCRVAKINYIGNDEWIYDDSEDLHYAPWPSSGEGWWTCVGDCYKWASDNCDTDGGCKLLCDALNILGGRCSLTIGAACGAYCARNSTFTPPPISEVVNNNIPWGYN